MVQRKDSCDSTREVSLTGPILQESFLEYDDRYEH